MAGKKKVENEHGSWVGGIEKYSRQIWLAGLGAYSKISNDGSKLFENLVKDGEKAEQQVKTEVDDTVKSSTQSAKSRVGDVKDRALGKWTELEEAFDKRLNSAISRLGVPSRNEVKELHLKVDGLTRQIEKLTGLSAKPVAVTKTASIKPVPKKAAVPRKTAAAKPAPAKPPAVAKPLAKAAAKPKAGTAKVAAAKPATVKKPPAARKPAAAKAPPPPATSPTPADATAA